MYYEYSIETGKRACFPVSEQVKEAVEKSGVKEGLCIVYCPHTSCGVTVNESAGPDVPADLMSSFERIFPHFEEYKHIDSEEHIRTSLTGSAATLIIENGQIVLGKWQEIYLCEFNKERSPRKLFVKIIEG